MKVGLHIPQVGAGASPEAIKGFARAAEEAGFDSLWVFDHVVLPREQRTPYPSSDDGKIGYPHTSDLLEPMVLLSFAAAVTSRIAIGTSVLILPMRQPVLHAKMLATLDRLASGRLIAGLGTGWWKEEFEVLGVPFERRGRRMDESIELMQALWRDEYVDFHGEFFDCDGWACNPKPVNGRIPIWIGGESPSQLRRVGRYADAWHAGIRTLPHVPELFEVAKEAAATAGRDPSKLMLTLEGAAFLRHDTPEQTAEALAGAARIGVDHAIAILDRREYGEQGEATIRDFGERFLPAIHVL